MSDLYWLTDEQTARLGRISQRATVSQGLMIGGCWAGHLRQPQRAPLAECAEGLWAAQDALQLLEAMG